MRVLVLAPHPYHIVRGTPIDLDLVLRVLTARDGTIVDLVVYAEGEDRDYPNLTIHRTPAWRPLAATRPGFSVKKLLCDLLLLFRAWSLVRKHRYDLIHAGEEAVYIAMLFRALYGIPYAYDLDSSLAEQMVEKMPWLGFAAPLFRACEGAAIRGALVTFPVCNSLAELCREHGATEVVTLHDISQLREPGRAGTGRFRRELGTDRLILLYVGNLERYQGIDLLLESFAIVVREIDAIDLVLIGGSPEDVTKYRARAAALGLDGRVYFLGPKPYDELDLYLAEADILTAPRILGRNTPMKIFPYLHSGRAVLVTDLPTHSQILSQEEACLAAPEPASFAKAIVDLARDPERRRRLGERGRAFVDADHTFEAHRRRLDAAYDSIERTLNA